MHFSEFKNNIGVTSVLAALGLREKLAAAESYAELKRRANYMNEDEWAHFNKRVERFAGHASSGEAVLLTALLYRLGYDELADNLDRGRTWRNMYSVSGEFRAAVAACVDPEK
jgi:hypothetical protein